MSDFVLKPVHFFVTRHNIFAECLAIIVKQKIPNMRPMLWSEPNQHHESVCYSTTSSFIICVAPVSCCYKGYYLFPLRCLTSAVWLWLFDFSVWPSIRPAGWLCQIYGSLELMVQNQDLCLWRRDWTGVGSLASALLSVSLSLSLGTRRATE